jgi:hypothetical protein
LIINPIERKINQVIQQGMTWLEMRFKHWTKPATSHQVIATLADLKRSKSELIAENMFLRQQLIVLERQVVLSGIGRYWWYWRVGSQAGKKPCSW